MTTDARGIEETPCVKCGERKVIRVTRTILRCLHCGHDEPAEEKPDA